MTVLWILLGIFLAYWIIFVMFLMLLDRRHGKKWGDGICSAIILPPLMLGLVIFLFVAAILSFDITSHLDDSIEES